MLRQVRRDLPMNFCVITVYYNFKTEVSGKKITIQKGEQPSSFSNLCLNHDFVILCFLYFVKIIHFVNNIL